MSLISVKIPSDISPYIIQTKTKLSEASKSTSLPAKISLRWSSVLIASLVFLCIGFFSIQIVEASSFFCDIGIGGGCGGGGGGGCFVSGTKVSLPNGEKKNIEEVKVGDEILGGSENNNVVEVKKTLLKNRPLFSINDSAAFVTESHPFFTTTGWRSINPEATALEMSGLKVGSLEIGDILITEKGKEILKKIQAVASDYFTPIYNFRVSGNRTYYANGFLVHNKGNITCYAQQIVGNDGVLEERDPQITWETPDTNTCDTDPPTLTVTKYAWDPTQDVTVDLPFSDSSGVGDTSATITDTDGEAVCSGSGSGDTLSLVNCSFTQAGSYTLAWTAEDTNGNIRIDQVVDDFIYIAAKIPAFNEAASKIIVSLGTVVADGVNEHSVTVKLRDAYGNPIVSLRNASDWNSETDPDLTQDVAVKLNFKNTTELDQLSHSGDAVRLVSPEFSLDATGDDSGSNKIITTGWLAEEPDGDGEYYVEIYAYSPTSNAYSPISSDDFDINLESVEYRVTAETDSNSGEQDINESGEFHFAPAMKAIPQALNFDAASGTYIAEESAIYNITLNATKRFLVNLVNQSATKNVSSLKIGLLVDAADPDVVWGETGIEQINASNVSETLNLDTVAPFESTNSAWETLPSPIDNIPADTAENFQMRSKPVLTAGGKTNPSLATNFRAYVDYVVNGRHPRHKSGSLSLEENEVNTDIYNTSIQIIGVSTSSGKFGTSLENEEAIGAIGDISRAEVKTSIDKNSAALISSATAKAKSCHTAFYHYTISNGTWNSLPCLFSNKSIAYFEGVDVYLEDPTELLTLPSGLKTILIHGGNLYIKNNFNYPDSNSSFGIAVLKNDNGDMSPFNDGGNIYLYPNVTNAVGAAYAEGAIFSVNQKGKLIEFSGNNCPSDGSGGFCDRANELHNQLYWKGSLITINTIGGSDKLNPTCPESINSMCSYLASGSEMLHRAFARIFDLNYLRTFHEDSGGIRAGSSDGLPTPGNTSNNYSVVVGYSSRVQTSTPPLFGSNNTLNSNDAGY